MAHEDSVRPWLVEMRGYLQGIESKLGRLESEASSAEQRQAEMDKRLIQQKQGFKQKSALLASENQELKKDIKAVQNITLNIISRLKNSVQSEELEKFKKRMDVWSPESLVSMQEAQRVLAKALEKD